MATKPKEEKSVEDYEAMVSALRKKGLSIGEAYRQVKKQHPEARAAFVRKHNPDAPVVDFGAKAAR